MRTLPRMVGIVSDDVRPRRPQPLSAASAVDLITDCLAARQTRENDSLPYRRAVIRRVFAERFGRAAGLAHFQRSERSTATGVWTFTAAGLTWKAFDFAGASDHEIRFAVLTLSSGWEEASTREQLGNLAATGAQFSRVPE